MRLVLIAPSIPGRQRYATRYGMGGNHGVLFTSRHLRFRTILLSPRPEGMLGMPPIIKERFQRSRFTTHCVRNDYDDCCSADSI